MEIQQHDGVVVDVAALRQGFAELLRARERCCRGGGRRQRLCVCCPPSPTTIFVFPRCLAKPCWNPPPPSPPRRRAAGVSINLSFPIAGSRRRRRRCTVRVLNAEVPSVRHSVIGDLDHGEYDSINHVHWNASARDLQWYVDALLSPRC